MRLWGHGNGGSRSGDLGRTTPRWIGGPCRIEQMDVSGSITIVEGVISLINFEFKTPQ